VNAALKAVFWESHSVVYFLMFHAVGDCQTHVHRGAFSEIIPLFLLNRDANAIPNTA
jgi:hypothetical protein